MNKNLHVLIIDDDKVDRMNLIRILKSSDFNTQFQEAEDGLVGLNYALAEEFDIIFLDFMLPKENGLEVLKKFRFKKGGARRRSDFLSAAVRVLTIER